MTRLPAIPESMVNETAYASLVGEMRQRLNEHRQRANVTLLDSAVDADPIGWITSNFYIPETGRPIDLYPSQSEPLAEALRRDEKGDFVYSTVLWSDIKKSAKSTIAAGVGMWFAHRKSMSSIKVLGNDLKQAESRVYEYLRRGVLLRQDWRSTIHVNMYKMTLPNYSVIEAVPVDPAGEAGGGDDLLLYTELWGWKSQKHQQMWSETTLSPLKYGKSLRWCESYAGYSGESPVLEQLYTDGVLQGQVLNVEKEFYANSRSRLFVLWNTKPRLPWQTDEYYCLPLPEHKDDLMVLTYDGWKAAEDVQTTDMLATRGDEGHIEYYYPTSIFRAPYEGDLLHLKHHRAHLTMTPNHRVLAAYANHTRKVKGILQRPFEYEYRQACEAAQAQIGWIPGHGDRQHEALETVKIENETHCGTDFVELLGWYLAEGNIHYSVKNGKRYPSALVLSQDALRNPKKYGVIRHLLDRLQLNYTARAGGLIVFNSRLGRYFEQFGKSHEKHIPRWVFESCSREQLERLLNAYLQGDGTPINADSWAVYTNSDQMRLDLMELAFMCGWRPVYRGAWSSAPEKGRKPIHHIRLLSSHIGWSGGNRRKHWIYQSAPDGTEVWCPTVPNGNFYVMQNGVCWWTGNSQEAASLAPNEFRRLHRNQWVSATESFLEDIAMWDRCKGEVPALQLGQPVVAGLDASVSGDCFAIVVVSRTGEQIHLREVRIWTPPPGGKLDYGADDGPKAYLRDLSQRLNLVEVAFDPFQSHDMATELTREGIGWFRPFGQGNERLIGDKHFYDIIFTRKFVHDGAHHQLREHIANANRATENGKLRLVKRAESLPIDGAVAGAMACQEARRLLID